MGMAFEQRLFDAEGSQVGLWTSTQPSLVCPKAYARRSGFALAAQRSCSRAWPVNLRPTGGGTVPQGPGIDNLVLAFDAPKGAVIEDVYRLLVLIITQALGPHGAGLATGDTPGSFCDGAWNLSAKGQKVVGTAQRWRPQKSGRSRVLAHALILTKGAFLEGADAVTRFQKDLGLGAVVPGAHTSLEAAFGLAELPHKRVKQTAEAALDAFVAKTE